MKKAVLFYLTFLLLSGILVGGCAAAEQPQPPTQEPPSNRVIKMEVADWEWIPDVVTVRPGEEIVLDITNTGRFPHGIWIPDLGINEGVRAGKTISVNIKVPAEPIELIIRCNDPECGTVEQHVNMIATLKVAE